MGLPSIIKNLPSNIKSLWTGAFGNRDGKLIFDKDSFFQPNLLGTVYGPMTQYNNYQEEIDKVNVIFENPALLKVVCLQCDLFSLGKIYVYKNGKDIGDHPALDRLNKPNPFQNGSQLLWDMMFWTMVGNAYCYVTSHIPANETCQLYFLDTTKIRFPDDFLKRSDQMVFSKAGIKRLNDTVIEYLYQDSTTQKINLGDIITLNDLTNGVGNRFRSPSRIPALKKVIANSEATLDANNINTRYTGKFLVSGSANPLDTTKSPLKEEEKESIEESMNGRKKVWAVKSMVEIRRFVENLNNLKLPEMYLHDYFVIGNMFNIPKDVLEAALQGATYENQEKSVGRHISYTLQPKGDDFMEGLAKFWGMDLAGEQLVIDWCHLPFMQVFEKDSSLINQTKITTLTNMLKLGISIEECNEFLDTNFKAAKYEQPTKPTPGAGQQG